MDHKAALRTSRSRVRSNQRVAALVLRLGSASARRREFPAAAVSIANAGARQLLGLDADDLVPHFDRLSAGLGD
jgi:hypothetical protein